MYGVRPNDISYNKHSKTQGASTIWRDFSCYCFVLSCRTHSYHARIAKEHCRSPTIKLVCCGRNNSAAWSDHLGIVAFWKIDSQSWTSSNHRTTALWSACRTKFLDVASSTRDIINQCIATCIAARTRIACGRHDWTCRRR